MEVGYKEVVLTLQEIMGSDAELKYLATERNFVNFTISKICRSMKEEVKDEEAFRNCMLIKKSTAELLENFGYNLFRQFETSFDCKFFDISEICQSDNEGSKTYVPTYMDKHFRNLQRHAIVTTVDYELHIYCYVLPPSPRRSSSGASQIYISTHSPLQNSSLRDSPHRNSSLRNSSISNYPESFLEDDPMNLNALESLPSQLVWVSHISSVQDRSYYHAHITSTSGNWREREYIWGSTTALPTTLTEPLCDNFWDNMLSEDENSDADGQWGGVFVKLATLRSSPRTIGSSSSGVSTPDGSESLSFTDENGVGSTTSHDPEYYNSSVERTASGKNGKPSDSDVANCIQTSGFDPYELITDGENSTDLKSENFETSVDDMDVFIGDCRRNGCSNNMSTQKECSEDPFWQSSSSLENYCTPNNANSIMEEYENTFFGDVSHLLLKDSQQEIKRLQAEKDARLPPLNVPLVWNRKCEHLHSQSFLALEITDPSSYIQEYKRIRSSKLNVFDCLRRREYVGPLNQTRVLEVIARPHYNIFPPADKEELDRLKEAIQNDEETELDGYLMASLETRRTFNSYPRAKYEF